jgi:hypothetical protein
MLPVFVRQKSFAGAIRRDELVERIRWGLDMRKLAAIGLYAVCPRNVG